MVCDRKSNKWGKGTVTMGGEFLYKFKILNNFRSRKKNKHYRCF